MDLQDKFLEVELEQAAFEAEQAAYDDESSDDDEVSSVAEASMKTPFIPEATSLLGNASTALAKGLYTEVACR